MRQINKTNYKEAQYKKNENEKIEENRYKNLTHQPKQS
jgi:hypothetical protein